MQQRKVSHTDSKHVLPPVVGAVLKWVLTKHLGLLLLSSSTSPQKCLATGRPWGTYPWRYLGPIQDDTKTISATKKKTHTQTHTVEVLDKREGEGGSERGREGEREGGREEGRERGREPPK